MKIVVDLQERSYPIYIQRGILDCVGDNYNLNRKVIIVTDSGVPQEYAEKLLKQCKEGHVFCISQGEASKNMNSYQKILEYMLYAEFSRKDLVVALGGGVVGDLAGFVASTYMRGIDFVNVPTTTLAQVDSSIGGKTAIDMGPIKNCVGAFYQPKAVFIDANTLDTLDSRHFYNGLVEALKSGAIYDKELFELLETCDCKEKIEEILYRSLMVKKSVVEIDEKELGLRKILNFGHTLGHGIESSSDYHLLHGEAVALGMVRIVDDFDIKARMLKVFARWDLPMDFAIDVEKSYQCMLHDKKKVDGIVTIVQVDTIGEAKLVDVSVEELKARF